MKFPEMVLPDKIKDISEYLETKYTKDGKQHLKKEQMVLLLLGYF